jgi:hypothetical protein
MNSRRIESEFFFGIPQDISVIVSDIDEPLAVKCDPLLRGFGEFELLKE